MFLHVICLLKKNMFLSEAFCCYGLFVVIDLLKSETSPKQSPCFIAKKFSPYDKKILYADRAATDILDVKWLKETAGEKAKYK